MLKTPDVLVLGGGGTLGEAWMSAVLSGLDEAPGVDVRDCGCYIGTSAGSIVAATLAAGLPPGVRLRQPPERPPAAPEQRPAPATALRRAFGTATDLAGAAAAPFATFALASSAGGGALVRRAALRSVPHGRRSLAELGALVARSGVDWDGRLRIVAVELESGRRVVFGSAGAPEVSVATAVQASCAIPGVFRPITASGRTYVDGGAWSPTNMDAAPIAPGDYVLCLNPTGSMRPTRNSLAGALGPVSRSIAAGEALALKGRGALVRSINPDQASAAAMGTDLMDSRRQHAVAVAGLAQGRALIASARHRAA